MYKVRYRGPIEELKGETALAVEDGGDFKVQFDDRDILYDYTWLGYNWHNFNKSDFQILYRIGSEEDVYGID